VVHITASRTVKAALVVAAAALVTAACSSSSTSSSTTDTSAPAASSSSASASTDEFAGIPTLDALYKGFETTPPTTSPAPAKNKKIYWISCGQAAPDCAIKSAAGEKAVKAMGWEFHLIDGAFGQGGAYATAIRTAIAAGADAIVEDAFPCSDVQQPLQEAKAKGVLVVPMETIDCSEAGTGDALFTVPMQYGDAEKTQTDWWKAFGKYSADYIIRASNGKAVIINSHRIDVLIELNGQVCSRLFTFKTGLGFHPVSAAALTPPLRPKTCGWTP